MYSDTGNRFSSILVKNSPIAALFFLIALLAAGPVLGQNLVIDKQLVGSQTVEAGEEITYNILYTCQSTTTPCVNAQISDTLDQTIEFVSLVDDANTASSGTSVAGDGRTVITWTLQSPPSSTCGGLEGTEPALCAGSAGVLTLVVVFPNGSTEDGTVYTNQGIFSADGTPDGTDEADPVTVTTSADIAANKSLVNGGAIPGETTYKLQVALPALGGVDYENVVVRDTLPLGASVISLGGGTVVGTTVDGRTIIEWNVGDVAATGANSWTTNITVMYDTAGTALDVGSEVTNVMGVTGNPWTGTGPGFAGSDFTHTLVPPDTTFGAGKSGTSTPYSTQIAGIGQTVSHTVTLSHNGNVPADSVILTDVIPVELYTKTIGYDPDGAVEVELFVSYDSAAATFVSLGVFTSSGSVDMTTLSPTDTVHTIKWVYRDVSPFSSAASNSVTTEVLATDRDGNAVTIPVNVTNCVSTEGPIQNMPGACTTYNVIEDSAVPLTNKSSSGSAFAPGDSITYSLTAENHVTGFASYTDPVLRDTIPHVFLLNTGSISVSSFGTVTGDLNNCTITTTPLAGAPTSLYDGLGETEIVLDCDGQGIDISAGSGVLLQYTVWVKPGTDAGPYTNRSNLEEYFATNVVDCEGNVRTGLNDGDPVPTCTDPVTVTIRDVAALQSAKWVRGELDDQGPFPTGFSKFPDVGETISGGSVEYRIFIESIGNVAADDLVLIDIFPHIGDGAVTFAGARNSEWATILQEAIPQPMVILAGTTTPIPVPMDSIAYSEALNPCRDEFYNPGDSPGCTDPMWLSEANLNFPITQTGSILLDFDDDFKINPLDSLFIDFTMTAPVNTDTGLVAWNSFGVIGTQDDASQIRLLPTEPIQVGITVGEPNELVAALGDYVWEDSNRDGIQNDGNTGINGVTVYLYDATGTTVLDSTITANDFNGDPGYYAFTDLTPGTFQVAFAMPPDSSDGSWFRAPTDTTGVTDNSKLADSLSADSDAQWTTLQQPLAFSGPIVLLAGDFNRGIDAGYWQYGEIGDFVWFDINMDGIQDPGEPGFEGQTIYLVDSTGTRIDSTTTDSAGFYEFVDLPPAEYTLEIDLPPVWEWPPTNVGDDALDNDFVPDVGTLGIAETIPIQVLSGERDSTWDAGVSPAVLGDTVWVDTNADGVQDPGEAGLPGVKVILYDGTGLVKLDSTVTGPDGEYIFNTLPAGDYVVEFQPPDGYFLSPDTSTVADKNSDANPDSTNTDPVDGFLRTGVITLDPGEVDLTVDAGVYEPAAIGDYVWFDSIRNDVQDASETPVEGVVVRLVDENDNAVVDVYGNPVTSTTTDANGYYLFDDLIPGDYRVIFEMPADGTDPLYAWVADSAGGDRTIDSDGKFIIDSLDLFVETAITNLESGEIDTTIDAGLIPAALGDFVWIDKNADGVQDADEVGLNGVIVKLVDPATNDTLATTVTADSAGVPGFYEFTDLQKGDYKVVFELPDGYYWTDPNVAAEPSDSLDSDAVAALRDDQFAVSQVVTLGPGELNPTIDAGIFEPAAIGDYVWFDSIRNDVQDPSEVGVEGVQVELLDENGQPVVDIFGNTVLPTTTDADGLYLFENLLPGDYQVVFIRPADYAWVQDSVGTDSTVDSDGNIVGDSLDPFVETAIVNLESAEKDTTIDAGILPARLGDYVWLDTNGDGIQDPGETGLNGFTVNLIDPVSGDTIATTVTMDSAGTGDPGYYEFNNLPAGNYIVEFVPQPGYYISPDSTGGDRANDSDADPDPNSLTYGRTGEITLGPGEDDPTIDAGMFEPAAIGDYVWFDSIRNDVQDPSEVGVEGVLVTLRDENDQVVTDVNGNTVLPTTTNADGLYLFDDLPPGDYYVIFTRPTGYAWVEDSVGTDRTVDSDGHLLFDSLDAFVESTPTNLVSAEKDTTIDAGILPARLGDFVWLDTNGDGIQDPGETGLNGFTVNLIDPVTGDTIATTVTMDSAGVGDPGYYEFNNLPAGDYIVEFVPQPGYYISPDSTGGDTTVDSDADPDPNSATYGRTGIVTLGPGEDDPSIDAGMFEPAAVGDFIWFDSIRNDVQDAGELGVEGIVVELVDANNNAVTDVDGNVVVSITTGADGMYLFDNLPPGDYRVIFEKPAVYAWVADSVGADTTIDSDGQFAGDSTIVFSETGVFDLVSAERDTTIDAGILPARLGNFVWEDLDGDGVQDDGEPGVENVIVILRNAAGDSLASDTTNATGLYEFNNLPAGDYIVEFVRPDGYYWTDDTTSTAPNDSLNSDALWSGSPADAITQSDVITLGPGEDNPTIDAGLVQPASLGDYVWLDLNKNGDQDDALSLGLNDVTVRLTDADGNDVTDVNGNIVAPFVTVNDSLGNPGFYIFDDLLPGDYRVEFDLVSGYAWTTDSTGTTTATDSDAGFADSLDATAVTAVVDLESGEHDPTIDAGMIAAAIGDFVWDDLNADGIQDPGEPGVEGVTVYLYDAAGTTKLDSTLTASDGSYIFAGLPAGTYQIGFVPPDGYLVSPQSATANDSLDSDVDPNAPLTLIPVTLAPAEVNPTIDMGIFQPASLGDYVWLDLDKDGVQDEDPSLGLNGVTVTLLDSLGNPATTDAFGNPLTSTIVTVNDSLGNPGYYFFGDLLPGDYQVVFTRPDEYAWTQDSSATAPNDSLDSDAGFTGDSLDATATTAVVNLESGEHDPTIDAGVIPASLGDFVWLDQNNDGVQDPGEPGIEGVQVILRDGVTGDSLDVTTTGPNGEYSFDGLPGDTSYVIEVVPPAGYYISPQDTSITSDSLDSDIDPVTGLTDPVTLAPGEDNPTLDAGLFLPAQLGDRVWFDTNADGIQDDPGDEPGVEDVEVLLRDTNGDPVLDINGDEVKPDTTDANGDYLFENLPPGDYVVIFVRPDTYYWTQPDSAGGDRAIDSDAAADSVNQDSVATAVISLESGEQDLTIDAGLTPEPAKLGNYVWLDTNQDGIQDGTESGIQDVIVILRNAAGDSLASDTTDATGFYEFVVPPGDYVVEFVRPNDYTFSPDSVGADSLLDSNGDPVTGLTDVITLNPGDDNPGIDQGMYPALSVGGFIWDDTQNQDGSYEDGLEPAVEGVVVNLLNADSTAVLDNNGDPYTVTTGPDGSYVFHGLPPGDYIVQVDPSNFEPGGALAVASKSAVGGDPDPDNDVPGDDNGQTVGPTWGSLTKPITLAPGTEPDSTGTLGDFNQTVDFGFQEPAFPVELAQFVAVPIEGEIGLVLNWTTVSETNNAGFAVEWAAEEGTFVELGWVEGYGNSEEDQSYSFRVGDKVGIGTHTFRLRQIDFDGAYTYSQEIEATVELPGAFILMPAYPNPFNPSAIIRFAVRESERVRVDMFDAVGRLVQRLYDEVPEAETMVNVRIDGAGLASGMYLIRLLGKEFADVKKVILAK